ncbi:MAG: c-type cytochrome [Acidobacteria bacterium]|nr:c-type cytochrome [Acidobacteriota bacterium]
MKPVLRAFLLLVVAVVLAAAAVGLYVMRAGLSAREQPGAIETFVARSVRNLAVARRARELTNPVEPTPEIIAAGRAHFADHCATCHANDGGGNTEMGRNLFPKAPDMRLPATQDLTDGELFWIIENGIRFTGMPGWSTGTKEGEEASWHLVHFIRHLPGLTPDEIEQMEALNPRSPEEIRQEIEAERFLQGGDPPGEPPAHAH